MTQTPINLYSCYSLHPEHTFNKTLFLKTHLCFLFSRKHSLNPFLWAALAYLFFSILEKLLTFVHPEIMCTHSLAQTLNRCLLAEVNIDSTELAPGKSVWTFVFSALYRPHSTLPHHPSRIPCHNSLLVSLISDIEKWH